MEQHAFLSKYGDWAFITGASSGLGAEFAEQLAKKGLNLVLVARREGRLKELAERLERDYRVATKIVSVDLAAHDFLIKIKEATKGLEVGLLVNNAGFCLTGEMIQANLEEEQRMFRVNCEVPFTLAMEFGRQMKNRGKGGIIFVSSSVAFMPVPYWTHYSATKSYTMFLGEGMYHELKKSGVDVLSLCPGGMKTEFQETAAISSVGAMEVGPVVKSAIRNLGKKPSVVPGWHIFAFFYLLPRMLPRRVSLQLFGYMISKITMNKA